MGGRALAVLAASSSSSSVKNLKLRETFQEEGTLFFIRYSLQLQISCLCLSLYPRCAISTVLNLSVSSCLSISDNYLSRFCRCLRRRLRALRLRCQSTDSSSSSSSNNNNDNQQRKQHHDDSDKFNIQCACKASLPSVCHWQACSLARSLVACCCIGIGRALGSSRAAFILLGCDLESKERQQQPAAGGTRLVASKWRPPCSTQVARQCCSQRTAQHCAQRSLARSLTFSLFAGKLAAAAGKLVQKPWNWLADQGVSTITTT